VQTEHSFDQIVDNAPLRRSEEPARLTGSVNFRHYVACVSPRGTRCTS